MPFVERVCKRESCLIILLKDERRYTRITLGFRSLVVEQFGREGREECSFGVRCFVVNGTESEGGHSLLSLAFVTVVSGRRVCPLLA